MYHYVRPSSQHVPQLKYLKLENFRRQLDWLCQEKKPISQEDFLQAQISDFELMDGFILTFDDALIDHYEFVLSELLNRGLWGCFYIPTGPYVNNKVLDVHLAHFLVGKHGGKRIVRELKSFKGDLNIPDPKEIQSNRYSQHDDEEHVKYFKRLINYELNSEECAILLSGLCQKFDIDLNPKDWYLSQNQILEMISLGMLIGSHTVNHRLMSNLSKDAQEFEISQSFTWLEENFGNSFPRTFCYPYGGFDSFSRETEDLLVKHEVMYSFNVEHRGMSRRDLFSRPQALPRYDCFNLPYGR